MHKQLTKTYTLFLFTNILLSTLGVGLAGNEREKRQNPFTPKAFVTSYWNRSIDNNLPTPPFILSKVSPLSAADAGTFEELAIANTLSTRLLEFCSAAHLVCFPNEGNYATDHMKYNSSTPSDDINSAAYSGNHNFSALNNALWFLRYSHHSANLDTSTNFYGDNQKNLTTVVGESNVQVQPGMFFREMMLKEGNVIPMPDIRDKLPRRSFLPRSVLTKMPFSSSKLNDLKRIFRVSNNSFMDKMIVNTLTDCEWAPNRGEIKRCVGSLEDMIDFTTHILGRNVTVRSTENVNGSNKNVVVGHIREINGGKAPQFVTCHQILFPFLLYYCHSVPKVRVYEADLLDLNSKSKINHGIAICHLDTTAWSPTHNAFLALGFGPGRIEVCHWVFENNLIWTNAH